MQLMIKYGNIVLTTTRSLFCSFRSSAGADTSWHVPLPPRGVLKFIENESRQHPHQVCIFTCQLKYWWVTYHFKNSHSPITLASISSINVVSIFRCSSSKGNPVHARRVDSSALVFSLSSHRYWFICNRIKKKTEAEGKNCHAKTMWSQEKPI